MLSYKLKHLCARVLASLSAFGIASISQRALAETEDFLQANGEYVWSTPSHLAFTASYEVPECTDVANATYTMNNEAVCTYTCNEGYAVSKSDGTLVSYDGQTGNGKYLIRFTSPAGASSLSGCKKLDFAGLSCKSIDPDEATGGAYKTLPTPSIRVVDDYVEKGCAWECNRGYATTEGLSGLKGDELTNAANGFAPLDTGMGSGYCYPVWYNVTYNCAGGTIVGTGVSTITETRAYSEKFKVETACEDTSGFFVGWKVTLE